jgi:ATP-dependent DNA helicase PIF1
MKIELNEQFMRALSLFEDSTKHIFLTGRAGTGKSTLLSHFRENTNKKIAVVAPTGVAAVNVDGETIHGFFGFGINTNLKDTKEIARKSRKKDLYRALDALIIDEISMVRADLLDCVDVFLRIVRTDMRPFGGVQVIMIGDLMQLPPVVTPEDREVMAMAYPSPFFFSSRVMKDVFEADDGSFEMLELTKIYRQSEQKFIDLLNKVRDKTATMSELAALNKRCEEGLLEDTTDYVVLVGTNAQADELNMRQLGSLTTEGKLYKGKFSGDFSKGSAPTDEKLLLKINSRVMTLSNDQGGRWVNGTMGTVVGLRDDNVEVKLDTGVDVRVYENKWTMYKSSFNEETKSIERKEVGSFTQLPLRLAWAITIHKSQGKTFEKVVVDLGRGAFASGQTYVALSRCKTLDGLKLRQPLTTMHLKTDWRVGEFMTFLRKRKEVIDTGFESA